MTLRIDSKKILNGAVLVLLFLASMNFYAKFFYIVFATLFAVMLMQKRLLMNQSSVPYLALGVLMSVYNMNEGALSMVRCMANVALYLVGYNLLVYGSKSSDSLDESYDYMGKMCNSVIVAISLGSFTHFILNYLNNSDNLLVRNTNDIWTGEIMAATGQAVLACFMLGLSVSMIVLPKKKIYRYVGFLAVIGALAYNLVLAGRTMIAVVCILFIVSLLYARKTSGNSYERFKVLFGFGIGLLALIVVFIYNVGGIRDYIFDSNLFERFEFSFDAFTMDDSRSDGKVVFLQNAWRYPFGGLNMRPQFGYAHDLLLDGYDEYGIFGLIFLVTILLLGVRSLYRVLKHTAYSRYLKMSLLCIYVSVLLLFCVEPILAGMPWLFACFCLINGCLDGMLVYDKRRSGI